MIFSTVESFVKDEIANNDMCTYGVVMFDDFMQ